MGVSPPSSGRKESQAGIRAMSPFVGKGEAEPHVCLYNPGKKVKWYDHFGKQFGRF